ncbi:uncharacterized protein BX664DRAFT_261992 [Halteromyces radiatus]|uniref:uncharacterized protein n=1 Tax=Halteromyces radiatus TaxID=101107 RepID=UPI00221F8AA1|nr:uncharacterized protein BX664DRAFT_261992 [Halteromyces radiatus]KAI8089827.1 hypothetical protein BX664DRAFT_261992 [Halteromyces radiatus]
MTNTKSRQSLPQWILRLLGYSSLAAALVSVAIYLYRRSNGRPRQSLPRPEDDTNTNNRSNSKKRKRVTISLKNTILWNPSSDVAIPNYAFHEHGQTLLSQLIQHHEVYIIIHVTSEEEQEEMKKLLESLEGLDLRKVLFCSTEEGKVHLIRHLEPQLHIEGGWEYDDGEDMIRKLRPFVSKLIWVITKRRRSSFNQSTLKEDDQGILGSNVELTDHILDTSLARELGFILD